MPLAADYQIPETEPEYHHSHADQPDGQVALCNYQRQRQRGPDTATHNWFVQQLFVAEARRRRRPVLRVDRAEQQEAGCGDAERLAELRDGPFEPCVPEQARSD